MSEHVNLPITDRHPLIRAYLVDLERALVGVDEAERTEVLASIREHLEAALDGAEDPGATEVEAVLARLGPVERIASEAVGDQSPADPLRSRWPTWIGSLLAALAGLCVLLFLANPAAVLPVAVTVGIVAVVGLRRGERPRRRYWTAIVLTIVTLLLTVLAVIATIAYSNLESETIGITTTLTSDN
jgi:hypothetical protein